MIKRIEFHDNGLLKAIEFEAGANIEWVKKLISVFPGIAHPTDMVTVTLTQLEGLSREAAYRAITEALDNAGIAQ